MQLSGPVIFKTPALAVLIGSPFLRQCRCEKGFLDSSSSQSDVFLLTSRPRCVTRVTGKRGNEGLKMLKRSFVRRRLSHHIVTQ